MRCHAYAYGGSRCWLTEDHPGKHLLYFETGTPFEWSDADTEKTLKDWGTGGT